MSAPDSDLLPRRGLSRLLPLPHNTRRRGLTARRLLAYRTGASVTPPGRGPLRGSGFLLPFIRGRGLTAHLPRPFSYLGVRSELDVPYNRLTTSPGSATSHGVSLFLQYPAGLRVPVFLRQGCPRGPLSCALPRSYALGTAVQ